MKAQDIMTAPVVVVELDTPIQDVARLLSQHRISAVPVVDADGRIAGIVSEGDLMRRPELGTERGGSWWLSLVGSGNAEKYIRSHGGRARDVMSKRVVTVDENTSVSDVAALLEKHHIKRVPVVRDKRPIGIVSRANLVQLLAGIAEQVPSPPADERELRQAVLRSISDAGLGSSLLNIIVREGRVEVWGATRSESEREAVRIAVERVVPRERVDMLVGTLAPRVGAIMGGE